MRNYFTKINITLLIVAAFAFHLMQTYFEMFTYNKVSNRPDVNFVDALFNNLRIDAE